MRKKNVLVVTGKLAADTVKASVNGGADVLVLDIEVAAFTTPALLRRSLPPKKFDLILISGLASATVISRGYRSVISGKLV